MALPVGPGGEGRVTDSGGMGTMDEMGGMDHGVSAMEIRHVGEFLEVKVQGKEPRIRAQKVAEATGTAEGSDA